MKISITGVLDDSSPYVPGVPTNPRRNLEVPRGTDLELVVSVVTPSNVPVLLTGDGTELLLTVKKSPAEHPPRIVKAASLSGNVGTFLIQPGDTRRMDPGLYGWDVWLTKDGLRNPVVPLSPFSLQAVNAAVPAQPPPPIISVTEGDTDPTVLDFAPQDITGWTVELLVGTPTPVVLTATIPVGTDGLALVNTSTLPVGKWAAAVKRTNLVPTTKTSDTFILEVLVPPAP